LFGREDSRIIEWDYGEFTGPEPQQALDIARLARETQGLAYKVGPAIIMESWDQDPKFRSTDQDPLSPVRLGAMLKLLEHLTVNSLNQLGLLGDATLTFQGRTMAKSTATDDRLKAWGLYTKGSDHIRDATRHAITGLRRAKQSVEFRDRLWPNAYNPHG
jgi:hypothetical protein